MWRTIATLMLLCLVSATLAFATDGFHQRIAACIERTDADCREVCRDCHAADRPTTDGMLSSSCVDCHDDMQAQDAAPSGTAVLHGNHGQVACVDCHDPHNGEFGLLKISNRGSALCLSCHEK
ncbi:MAG: cytochrome c3 family protein [Desulfuromonadaceae bacterium]|nr:cytochrome c3 family protein [Desulfuromonadaceae bacterium]